LARRRRGPRRALSREELLADYPPEIRSLAEQVRDIVLSALGEPEERVHPAWRGIAYHDERAGYVCGIFPRKTGVRLLFEHGAALPDPESLFNGGGAQTRYREVRPGDTIPEDAICRMIGRAVQHRAVR
jgi:hypothetical protein